MQWHDLSWPAYGPPHSEDPLKDNPEIPVDMQSFRIELKIVSDPGSVIEVRDLFRRLYGEPGPKIHPNPYIASYTRLKGDALGKSANGSDDQVIGTVDYRYWLSLSLGYIESVRVSPTIRRRRLGVKLVNYALEHMRSLGIGRVYSFAVNPDGFRLLESAHFESEKADDPGRPWRRWFHST